MKRNKILLYFSTVLLVFILIYMFYDLFFKTEEKVNRYRYNVEKLKQIDTTLICYKLINSINSDSDSIHAITILKDEEIIVAGKNKVQFFKKNGKKITEFKIQNEATAIATDEKNQILVASKKNIKIYNIKGKLTKNINNFNDKTYLTSILAENENIFVADAGNKIIYKLDYQGNIIQEIGKKTEKFSGFIIPSPYFDIQKGREGQLWAVNTGRHELIAFNSEGEVFSSWKKTSMGVEGFSGCCNPSHISILSNGDFVTSEKGMERIKIHSSNGDFKCLVAAYPFFEKNTKGIDLVIDTDDRIYAIDTKKQKILIFESTHDE
jgi:hypothetical protein